MGTVKEVKSVKIYLYEGKKYKSLKEIAEVRGVKQVTKRDFERLGIKEHYEGELVETEVEGTEDKEVWENEPLEETDKDLPLEKLFGGGLKELYEDTEEVDTEEVDTEEVDTEEVDTLKNLSIEEFASTIKKMELWELTKIANKLGIEWKENNVLGIKRMRVSMALREYYYPNGERLPQEPKSEYKGMSLDTLKGLADSLGVEYKIYSNDKITKMWLVKAINDFKKSKNS